MRRLEHATGRILFPRRLLPRRADVVETLAVLHEIRACYDEVFRLTKGLGDGGKGLMPVMREALAMVDRICDVRMGSLRRTEANAADFAAAMRSLGRDADGSMRHRRRAGYCRALGAHVAFCAE